MVRRKKVRKAYWCKKCQEYVHPRGGKKVKQCPKCGRFVYLPLTKKDSPIGVGKAKQRKMRAEIRKEGKKKYTKVK